jgi:hypothetical protein
MPGDVPSDNNKTILQYTKEQLGDIVKKNAEFGYKSVDVFAGTMHCNAFVGAVLYANDCFKPAMTSLARDTLLDAVRYTVPDGEQQETEIEFRRVIRQGPFEVFKLNIYTQDEAAQVYQATFDDITTAKPACRSRRASRERLLEAMVRGAGN